MQASNYSDEQGVETNEEVEFWHDFIVWWEGKYHESAPPRISEALNIAEAKDLKALAEQVEYLKKK
jgi:hypothetical protein